MKKRIALTASLVIAAGTMADDSSRYVLAYSADDFKSKASVRALYQRVRSVARDHCPDYFRERDLPGVTDCVREVTEDLVRSIDHPALTAYASDDQDVRIARTDERG